jgi:hypothetical protein
MTISQKKRAEIVEALKANPNARAVARQVGGVSQKTVWNIAKQTGLELSGGHFLREKRAEITGALKANPNTQAVARQVGGVSQSTVYRLAKKANIKLGARGRPRIAVGKPLANRAMRTSQNTNGAF